jgi:hypothetical protein
VAELRAVRPSIVTVLATSGACDRLLEAGITGATLCRVAPDEVLVLGLNDDLEKTVGAASATIDESDALVLDTTDAWSGWGLEGPDAHEVFTRLSELRLPVRGFEQGAVANMPAKILVDDDRITVLVPSMFEQAFRERVLHDARHVGVREAT